MSCCSAGGGDGVVSEGQTGRADRILKTLVRDLCFGGKTSDHILERL